MKNSNSQGDCPNRPLSLSDKQNFGRPTLNHQRRSPESLFRLYHALIDNRLCPSRLGKARIYSALLSLFRPFITKPCSLSQMFGHTYNNVYLCSVKTLNRKMKRYRYIKSNAFTTGASLGNPAACVFMGEETLSPEQMQAVAREHKGFVMEVVFCSQSDVADCKLTYYSSECEVDFCGHGTIATMYSMIKDNPVLRSKSVVKVETNRKGIVEVFNAIDTEDAVYITAPDPIEHPVNLTVEAIGEALGLKHGAIRQDLPIRIIDAGLRTLIVPITDLETEISVFPDEQELKIFCEGNDIDIILIFSKQTADTDAFAHTRVFAPKFGYLEDPATGSGNSAFANYLLSENLWNGAPITIEQGGNDRIFNSVKVKYSDGQVLFGGKSTIRIEGDYLI